MGDYSNLFLTSARSLGCVADHSLKPEICDESQLLTLSTSSYGIVVVHNGIKKKETYSQNQFCVLGECVTFAYVCAWLKVTTFSNLAAHQLLKPDRGGKLQLQANGKN